jgi:hypothetical protein
MYKDLAIDPNTYVGVCTIFLHCILILPSHFQRRPDLRKRAPKVLGEQES